jgi:hypothetical protein
MKKTHPSHYLLQLQMIMVVVLGVITMFQYVNYVQQILPVLASLAVVLFGMFVLRSMGRMFVGEYVPRYDYVHGSSLPSRVYYPQV